jgi:hypothetical protein
VRLEPVASLLARIVPAEDLPAADVGGQRLQEHQQRHHRQRSRPPPTFGHERRDARQRKAAEHRERRVGRQQPAAEVTRLHAQVDEQRQRHRHEHQAAHQTATQLEHRADERGERGRPAQPPGEAVEVVRDAARLLPRLRLVRRHLGLVAKVPPPGVERVEQVRVKRHEDEAGERDTDREAGERLQDRRRPPVGGAVREPPERRYRHRQQREPGRVLERQGEACRRARGREEAQPPVLVGPHREADRERHAHQRPHVSDRHARVRHRQEREGEQRGRHQPLAHPPEPPRGPVRRRDPRRTKHCGQRAGGDPHLRGVLVELVGDVAEGQVEEEAERAVHHPEQPVDQVRVGRGVLVVARVEVLPEHLHRSAGEMRSLVDRVHERQPVVDVPEAQAESGGQNEP